MTTCIFTFSTVSSSRTRICSRSIKKIIAFAVDRFCEILPGKKLKKEIFKEITRRSLGCTGKIAELNGSKLRGVNLSLVKLDDSVRELEKEENKIDRVIYLSF